jgi:hypothetical protein
MKRGVSQCATPINDTQRCGARTGAGGVCQCPPMPNGKCRPGAPRGAGNGNYRDGHWTGEAIEERQFVRSLLKATLTFGAKA